MLVLLEILLVGHRVVYIQGFSSFKEEKWSKMSKNLIFTDLGDQIMNKYLYTIILNIVYKYKSTYVILQNKIIKVEIIALKMQFYKIRWL